METQCSQNEERRVLPGAVLSADSASRSEAKRILQIIPTLVRGGAERQCVNLSLGLSRRGYDVHVAVLSQSAPQEKTDSQNANISETSLLDELISGGVTVHFIGKRMKLDPCAFIRLCDVISEICPDAVHTWLFAANCYGRAAAKLCGVQKIFANERCSNPWKSTPQILLDRLLDGCSSGVTTNTKSIYVQAKHKDKYTYISNGVDSVKLINQSGREDRKDILAEFGLSPDAFVIGCVARLWPQKRLKWAIWSMDIMRRIHPDSHLLIIGGGPQKAALMRYRRLYRSEEYVHFLGVRNDVPRLYRAFNALWLTSLYEGQPNAVLEAMTLGTPVVCASIDGMEDIIQHEQNGFLVEPGDIPGFVRWTTQILENPTLRQTVIRNAQNTIERKFDLESMVSQYENLYR